MAIVTISDTSDLDDGHDIRLSPNEVAEDVHEGYSATGTVYMHKDMALTELFEIAYQGHILSDDGADNKRDIDREREKRTRRRFTTAQLTMLEQLYHRVSHPTREQREEVAREADM
jgi:hypothetical protein